MNNQNFRQDIPGAGFQGTQGQVPPVPPVPPYRPDPYMDKRFYFLNNFRPKYDPNHIFTDKEIKSFRHSWEIPMYAVCVILNILIVICLFAAMVSDVVAIAKQVPQLDAESVLEMTDEEWDAYYEDFEAALEFDDEQTMRFEAYVVVITLLLFLLVIVAYNYAQFKSSSVKLSYRKFPEVEAIVRRQAERLNLKTLPEIYLYQSSGQLNAFTSFVVKRRYLVVYSELFEVAYLEHKDMRALEWIIAHEMAHVKLRHVDPFIYYTIMFSQTLPIIGSALSRAREYSCDRIAQQLTGDTGVRALFTLITGKHLYTRVDVMDYINDCRETNRNFFVFIYNLVSSHPLPCKRIPALLEPDKSGPMF